MINLPETISKQFKICPAGRIDQDLACLHCGYNVRGLLPAGVCPECGIPICRSMYGDLLMYCDPVWVKTLADGANVLIVGIYCMVLNVLFSWIAEFFWE